jgi:TonB family protein
MKASNPLRWLCWMAAAAAAMAQTGDNDTTVRALKLEKFVLPEFPAQARLEGVGSGSVTAVVGRDASGAVTDVLILAATHPAMAAAATDAIRQWHFQPADPAEILKQEPGIVRIDFRFQGVISIIAQGLSDRQTAPRSTLVRTVTALDRRPHPLAQPMPSYPKELATRAVEGDAIVAYYIDGDGRVRLPHVVSASSDEFGQAAVDAIATWRYEPPRQRGRPVVVSDSWAFQFHRKT